VFYLKKLKTLLQYKILLNNYFLIAIFIFLTLFSIKHIIVIIFLIIYGIYLYKKSKFIFWCCFILSLFSVLIYLITINYKIEEKKHYYGQVISIDKKEDYQIIIIKNKIKNIMIYENGNAEYSVLDYIEVEGEVKEIEPNRIPKGFNYKKYLQNEKIGLVISGESIRIVDQKFNISYIRELLIKYVERYFPENAKSIIKGLVIGENKDFSDEFMDSLKINGIMHLFAISGTHIAILVLFLEKILKRFKNKSIFISSFLAIYLVVTNFSPSVLRAVLMYYFILINKKFKLNLSSLDIVSIVFIFLLIYNPFYLENLGFCLSFLMAFTIVLIAPLMENKNDTLKVFFISLSALIITLPLVININHQVNLLSPLINILFIVLVGEIMLPFAFASFMFFPIGLIFNYLCKGFMVFSSLISKYFCINIKMPYFSIYHSLIYYGLIILILIVYKTIKKRYLFLGLLLIFLTCFLLFNSVKPFLKVVFLDLYYGESTVITYGFNTIIIDTGDGKNNEVTEYLLREGIYKVDYLILTHNHNDHNGEAEHITANIKVKNTVMSIYDNNNYLYTNNIHLNKEMKISMPKMDLIIFPPLCQYANENDNSLITYIKTDVNMLFLGDIEKEGEKRLNNFLYDVDIVKIAHHGSKTSTGINFLNMVNFKYAVIQSGRIKSFGFPNVEVINKLNNYKKIIYRTDKDYTITYKLGKFYRLNN